MTLLCLLSLLGAISPALWISVRGRRALLRCRRLRRGLCLNCGYDLRGSTSLCGECGTPIEGAMG